MTTHYSGLASGMNLEIVLPDESVSMPAAVLVETARVAEDLGFAAAWLPDHLLPPGEYGPTYGGVYEPLVAIAHLAAVTTRLRFGSSVIAAPLRDPFLLAKQVATLHHLSGARVILGLGVGWNVSEFAAVGADFRHRGAVTDDQLALLEHLFAGGTAPYDRRRFAYAHGVFAPVPQGEVPILIGGNSEAALRRAARYGRLWQGLASSPEDFARSAERLAELAQGRDVEPSIRLGWGAGQEAAEVADIVRSYVDVGARRVAVHFGDYEATRSRMAELVALLGD